MGIGPYEAALGLSLIHIYTRPKSLTAPMPAHTEMTEASHTAGRISKGAAHPAARCV